MRRAVYLQAGMQQRDAEGSELMLSPRRDVCLQTAFLNETRPNPRNVRLRIAQRGRRGMN